MCCCQADSGTNITYRISANSFRGNYSFLLLERIACLLFPEESLILENIFFAKRNGFSEKSLVDFPGAYHFSQINSIVTFFVYFSGICLNSVHCCYLRAYQCAQSFFPQTWMVKSTNVDVITLCFSKKLPAAGNIAFIVRGQ